jgi:ubiquinol-cytochrome c reductase cytochrome b subunit/menaquinol-cytochrome c reductase cytochrome b subunit
MAIRIPKPPLPGRRKPPPPSDPRENGDVALKDQAAEVGAGIVGWVDERTGAAGFAKGMLFRKVPKGTNWFYTLGSATLFAFLSQAVTGVFLAMYYNPDPDRAYDSVQHITNDVFLGDLVRGMHRWGATVMIVLIFLHMGRTFFFGAYKYPRELNWVIGVVLLVLTLAMGFTGYLLPFDQRSGPEFGATTLSRFYAIHMLLIPILIAALITVHLYLVVKLGTTAPPWLRAKLPEPLEKENV